jgi:hypothetical protein
VLGHRDRRLLAPGAVGSERGEPRGATLDHDLGRSEGRARTREALGIGAITGDDGELVFASDQDIAASHEWPDQIRGAVGTPEAGAQIRVDHAGAGCPLEQLDRRALRSGAEHRGDAGHEHGARLLDRNVVQVVCIEGARGGPRPEVGEASFAVAEHRAGRASVVRDDPAQVDAVARERGADPIAGVVGAEPADPRDA